MSVEHFFGIVRAWCGLFNGSISSYGRTFLHNIAVGGVAGSAHQVWLAADIEYDQPVPSARKQQMADRLGLRLIEEGDHDHLQPVDWPKG